MTQLANNDPQLQILNDSDATVYLDDLYKGVIIFGGIGSGKTSGSGSYFARQMLSLGYGGMVLCAGHDEKETWMSYAIETGRENDVIVVSSDTKHRFNFIDYEFKRDSSYIKRVDTVVSLFRDAFELSMRQNSMGNDAFWLEASVEFVKNSLVFLEAAQRDTETSISLSDVKMLSIRVPRNTTEREKRLNSYDKTKVGTPKEDIFATLYFKALEVYKSEEIEPLQKRTIGAAISYFVDQFVILPERTRESVVMTVGTVIDKLISGTTYEYLNTDTTFSPTNAFHGKIIILDIPITEYGDAGRLVQVILKRIFQNEITQRKVTEYTAPVFLWSDEFQNFTTEFDRSFMNIQRKYRACTFYLTQTIGNIADELGNIQAAKNLIGQFQTAVFHANADPETNTYAAERVGRTYQTRTAISSSEFMGGGMSITPTYAYQVEPTELLELRTGGEINDLIVDAVIIKSGKPFRTKKNFAKISFSQERMLMPHVT